MSVLAVLGQDAAAETSESGPVATMERTQVISLVKGWNAVYLEVEPSNSDPASVFAEAPIDMAAAYFASKSSAQFVSDPGVDLFKNLGWAVWYKENRPDAFLTTLDAVYGRRAYLLHSVSDAQWSIKGAPLREEVEWRAGQINLVGFPLASPGAPSFGEFFKSAKGLRTDRIYRLVGGSWKKVTDPASTPMRSGEAFWVYCDAPTKYKGPLEVETKLRRGLVMADGSSDNLILRNISADPLEITIEHLAPLANPVPLSLMVKVIGAPSALVSTMAIAKPSGVWMETLTLEPGSDLALPFEVRASEMVASLQVSLLKISTALGTEAWVPVTATRSDLSGDE